MNDEAIEAGGGFGSIKGWIVGLTGVLVVVPALLNAGVDIYKVVRQIPRSESERVNTELFQKHFGEDALFRGDVPVRTALGTVTMELEVHQGGDIFVKYGSRSQWFPSPLKDVAAGAQWLPAAWAQRGGDGSSVPLHMTETRQDGKIRRERYLRDGTTEVYLIDPRTGDWERTGEGTYSELPTSTPDVQTFQYPVIDLTNQ